MDDNMQEYYRDMEAYVNTLRPKRWQLRINVSIGACKDMWFRTIKIGRILIHISAFKNTFVHDQGYTFRRGKARVGISRRYWGGAINMEREEVFNPKQPLIGFYRF